MSKVWFVTGASRGFGKAFVREALERGDRVAATARKAEALADLAAKHGDALLPLVLDVTDKAAVTAAVQKAHRQLGRLDVVVNNAGYGLFGAVEELTEALIRAQLETNFFGALWVTQAALPLLRAQQSGHFIHISSMGGVAAFPMLSGYHASKWALEGMSESLAQEVAPFGIKVTIVEPGPFSTDWAGDSAIRAPANPAYDPARAARAGRADEMKRRAGDPLAAAKALLRIVDAKEPPLRVLFGRMATEVATSTYAARLKTWADWKEVSIAAQDSGRNNG